MDYSDLLVLSNGQAGSSLARPPAPSGKVVFLLYWRDSQSCNRCNWQSKAVFGDCGHQVNEACHRRDGSTFHRSMHYDVESDPDVHGPDPLCIGQGNFEGGIYNRSLAGLKIFFAFGLRAAAIPAFLPLTLGSLHLCHSAAP